MMRESQVVYVELHGKTGEAGNADAGTSVLHGAHGSMTEVGWELVATLADQKQGTPIGVWLFFERDLHVTDQVEEMVAEMDVDERRALMDRAVAVAADEASA